MMLRKQILPTHPTPGVQQREISIPETATILVTSETVDHPVDHICDGRRGPGATRWVAKEPGEQTIILAFDTPLSLNTVSLEIEEFEVSRTQELTVAISKDRGETYRELLRQEYHFSPSGTTFERERWTIAAPAVTHLKIWIKPDKSNTFCYATITSLSLE